ncbi:DTW domain-containing protein 1 [Amphibalanus amphitrite]|uniref:tRNA-uridine aminocarboxypropyltransferase 1 n=1 Tax=Amphibalanus amphitrite TaxID=1232801 RepID=A0A6A4X2E0_AMPAM|nr:DTW domain-containing protein 1 [Amphibalanus amphitrite]
MTSLQPAEPFKHLNISSAEVLERLTGRSPCPKCHKSRMYFCYNCLVPVDALTGKIPHVRLPVEVEIVKHPGETNGKSTAVHAAVLAPDDVTLRTYPDVGSYDPDETVLVFPDSSAGSVADVSATAPARDALLAYQRGKPRTHLATIEAVYYFVRELQESRHDTYGGEFDDLLFILRPLLPDCVP